MQLANSHPPGSNPAALIRPAVYEDAPAVQRLMQTGQLIHTHIDWRPPGDWLGWPGFYVYDPSGGDRRPRRMFGQDPYTVVACLAVIADPPPAAWVRLAAFLSSRFEQAQALFATAIAELDPGITEIAWFVDEDWSIPWLDRLGFSEVNRVVNYLKEDIEVPAFTSPAGLVIRPVAAEDMPALAAIEAAAFEPRWRHSAGGLFLAWGRSLNFDVAVLDGEPVGFQMSHGGRGKAHLSRMTVDPVWQGQGIGAALLAHAIADYRARGIRTITLNTQADNIPSQRLYTRFGFRLLGESYPVWAWQRGQAGRDENATHRLSLNSSLS